MMLNSFHWTYGKFTSVLTERHDILKSIWRSFTTRAWLQQAGYYTGTQNVLPNRLYNNYTIIE